MAALLLSELFMKGLTFTVGKSLTSGKENVVTWNDVHHKTSIYSKSRKACELNDFHIDINFDETVTKVLIIVFLFYRLEH